MCANYDDTELSSILFQATTFPCRERERETAMSSACWLVSITASRFTDAKIITDDDDDDDDQRLDRSLGRSVITGS